MSPDRCREFVDASREKIKAALQAELEDMAGPSNTLADALAYSLSTGGKRYRAIATLLAVRLMGEDERCGLPHACAIEMVHLSSLIRDDLPMMDNAENRRGFPTLHRKYTEAIALLAADVLLMRAFELLASDVHGRGCGAECCCILARALGIRGAIGGQFHDLYPPDTWTPTLLKRMYSRKTGSLFAAALELGGAAAGASPVQRQSLAQFGTALGVLYQLQDDLIDGDVRQSPCSRKVDQAPAEFAAQLRDEMRREALKAASGLAGNSAALMHFLDLLHQRPQFCTRTIENGEDG